MINDFREVEFAGERRYAMTLADDQFKDIWYTYGKVSFDEGDDCTMRFDYDVVEGRDFESEVEKSLFENKIGDALIELIKRGIEDRNLVFSGGTNEA